MNSHDYGRKGNSVPKLQRQNHDCIKTDLLYKKTKTPRKINGWNLRTRAPWKRKLIFQTIIFRFELLILWGVFSRKNPPQSVSCLSSFKGTVPRLFDTLHQQSQLSTHQPINSTLTHVPGCPVVGSERINGLFFHLLINAWNLNDPCFGWKRPCFWGLTFKNRGHLGSR